MEVALRGFLIGGCRDSTAATAAAGRAGSSSAVVPPPTLDGGSQEPPGRPFRSCSRSRVAQTTKELTETCAPQAPLDPVPQAAHSHRKDPAASCFCSPSLCATLDACFSALSIDPLPLPLLAPIFPTGLPSVSSWSSTADSMGGRHHPPRLPTPDPQNGTNRRRGVIEYLLQLEGDGAAIRSTAEVVAAAEASGSGATVLRLLQLGCPRPDRSECVVAAANEGRLEMLRWLLKYGDALGIKGRRGAAAVGTDRSAAAAAGLSRAALCCWRRCPGGRTGHHTMQLGWGRQCERCWSIGWAAGAAAGASRCHVTTAPRC